MATISTEYTNERISKTYLSAKKATRRLIAAHQEEFNRYFQEEKEKLIKEARYGTSNPV